MSPAGRSVGLRTEPARPLRTHCESRERSGSWTGWQGPLTRMQLMSVACVRRKSFRNESVPNGRPKPTRTSPRKRQRAMTAEPAGVQMGPRVPGEVTSASVFVQIGDVDVEAGRLYSHRRRVTESASFAYADGYIANPIAYPLDPSLPLVSGLQQTSDRQRIFGAFSDSCPDRWGQRLIERAERRRAAS